MATFSVNGTTLEYEERGTGETVLLVHGSNGDMRTWAAQMEALSPHYRTVTYSRRFHWPNESISDGVDYSMPQQLDDLEVVIGNLGSEPVHLIGHSYGAFLSLLLAMRSPQLIKSMVLAEPPIFTLFLNIPPAPPDILKMLISTPLTGLTIMKFVATGLIPASKAAENNDLDKMLEIFGSAVLGKDVYRNLSPARLEQARANNFKMELLGSGFLPLNAEAIQRLQIPTLLINGADSPALFHRFNDRLQVLLPNVKRKIIPSASHMMHEDNSTAYNAAILEFLNG
ncbi:MAG: alpha/beta hydrolase [Anaerolineae bacterium]|nr:alpha/beta hydrolase [Anaerolineae bacterium]